MEQLILKNIQIIEFEVTPFLKRMEAKDDGQPIYIESKKRPGYYYRKMITVPCMKLNLLIAGEINQPKLIYLGTIIRDLKGETFGIEKMEGSKLFLRNVSKDAIDYILYKQGEDLPIEIYAQAFKG